MTQDQGRELTYAEERYVEEVRFWLRGLPRQTRNTLTQAVIGNLQDRAPEDGLDALREGLGTAASYAGDLLADAELAEPGSVARARRRHRIAQILVTAGVLVVAGALVGGATWWWKYNPGIRIASTQFCSGADREVCDQTGLTANLIADAEVITCRQRAEVYLTLELFSGRQATVTGADIPGIWSPDHPDKSDQALALLDVTPWIGDARTGVTEPTTFPVAVADYPDKTELVFHFELCRSLPRLSYGGWMTLYSFELHYRSLGLDRTALIDFPNAIVVSGGGV